jgi:NADPH:quinone reductase-like Zn-dependent oxidoreductase
MLMNSFEVGGVGSVACQMAKNAYQAGKVITTVSTEKVGKVDKLLGNGVVDQSLSEISIGIMPITDTYT